ncbi:MazG nucleotide pyrophosphohydrolase domain-containing protein [Streptomyces yaizuensis]|uniref:NTP pyrophosphohydrolase MazG-like domain-containing protein n=1 Tax=Streptomyces yaizuensis TaxID=2989713 RepID=A0ABQ5NYY8_9ACTN|nr:MazG nucleotide pyrophosphohydrolase domain-containing protein [Streptomyces sp. YSPA8]GLF95579.1 hypothetical protein SYYSPA8_14800 [Streptomyces sp. YSPA8]
MYSPCSVRVPVTGTGPLTASRPGLGPGPVRHTVESPPAAAQKANPATRSAHGGTAAPGSYRTARPSSGAPQDSGSPVVQADCDSTSRSQRFWENKLTKGFNTTDTALEFGLLTAEVGEAFTAWRKHLPDLGEELADVFRYLVAVAEMNGIDLGEEVVRKIDKNARRVYEQNARGALVRTSDEEKYSRLITS